MKRLIALFLVMVMLIGQVPVFAFAEGEEEAVPEAASEVIPETPAAPTPAEPETPAAPETPAEPETPQVPEPPQEPETPVTPETPTVPEQPETEETETEETETTESLKPVNTVSEESWTPQSLLAQYKALYAGGDEDEMYAFWESLSYEKQVALTEAILADTDSSSGTPTAEGLLRSTIASYIAEEPEAQNSLEIHEPITLTGDLEIPENFYLIIAGDGSLTVPAEYTLAVNGSLVFWGGSVTVNGRYEIADASHVEYNAVAYPDDLFGASCTNIPKSLIRCVTQVVSAEGFAEAVIGGKTFADSGIDVTGDVTLTGKIDASGIHVVICDNARLTIAEGAELTCEIMGIGEGSTLDVKGALYLHDLYFNGQIFEILGQDNISNPDGLTEEQLRAVFDAFANNSDNEQNWIDLNSRITLTQDLEIPNGFWFTIPRGASLTVPKGITLTNNGAIQLAGGKLTVDGEYAANEHKFSMIRFADTYFGDDDAAAATNLPNSCIRLAIPVRSTEDFNAAVSTLRDGGYATGEIQVVDSFSVSTGMDMENVDIFIREGFTLTIPQNVSVSCDELNLGKGATLFLAGSLKAQNFYSDEGIIRGPGELDLPRPINEMQLQNKLDAIAADPAIEERYVAINSPIPLSKDLVIPEGVELHIWGGGELYVNEGVALTNNGSIQLWGGYLNMNGGSYVPGRNGEAWVEYHMTDYESSSDCLGTNLDKAYIRAYQTAGSTEELTQAIQDVQNGYGSGEVQINDTFTYYGTLNVPDVGFYLFNGAEFTIAEGASITCDGLGMEDGTTLVVNGMLKMNYFFHGENYTIIGGENIDLPDRTPEEALRAKIEAACAPEATDADRWIEVTTSIELTYDLEIPEGVKITLMKDSCLYAPEGIKLSNAGTINLWGGYLSFDDPSDYSNSNADYPRINYKADNYKGTPVVCEATNVDQEQICFCVLATDSAAFMNYVGALKSCAYGAVEFAVDGDITLTKDVNLPNATIALFNDTRFTVPASKTLTCDSFYMRDNSTLVVEGTLIANWFDGDWSRVTGDENIYFLYGTTDSTHGSVSPEDFLRSNLIVGDKFVYLDEEITLTRNLKIPIGKVLVIRNGGSLIVPDGITLTNDGEIQLMKNSVLAIENGGLFENCRRTYMMGGYVSCEFAGLIEQSNEESHLLVNQAPGQVRYFQDLSELADLLSDYVREKTCVWFTAETYAEFKAFCENAAGFEQAICYVTNDIVIKDSTDIPVHPQTDTHVEIHLYDPNNLDIPVTLTLDGVGVYNYAQIYTTPKTTIDASLGYLSNCDKGSGVYGTITSGCTIRGLSYHFSDFNSVTSGKTLDLIAESGNPSFPGSNENIRYAVLPMEDGSAAPATITAAGRLTAKKVTAPTTVTVVAYSTNYDPNFLKYPVDYDGRNSCQVTILPAVTSVQIRDENGDVVSGKTIPVDLSTQEEVYFVPTVLPDTLNDLDVPSAIGWTSSDKTEQYVHCAVYPETDENGNFHNVLRVFDMNIPGSKPVVVTLTAKDPVSGKSAAVKLSLIRTAQALYLPEDIHVGAGCKVTLVPEFDVDAASLTGKTVVYSLANKDDAAYASITAAGVFTAKANAAGRDIEINAYVRENPEATASCIIHVDKKTTKVTIANLPEDPDIKQVGTSRAWKLDIEKVPTLDFIASSDGHEDFVWMTNNASIAYFEGSKLHMVKPGVVTVTAAATDGSNVKDSIKLTLVCAPKSAKFSSTEYDLAAGCKITLGYTLLPENSANTVSVKGVVFALQGAEETGAVISNTGVVSVKAVNEPRTITATIASVEDPEHPLTDPVRINLLPNKVTAVNIQNQAGDTLDSRTVYSIDLEDTPEFTLYAQNNPEAASQKVTWSSNKPGIAFFEDPNEGHVKLIGTGAVTLTATAADGSGKKASIKLNVVRTIKNIAFTLPDGSINESPYPEMIVAAGGKAAVPYKLLSWTEGVAPTDKAVTFELLTADGDKVPATVATITKAGVVATKAGSAGQHLRVTVSEANPGEGNEPAVATIYVWIVEKAASLTIENATIKESYVRGNKVYLNAKINGTYYAEPLQVVWTTSNPKLATVDQAGRVTIVSEGGLTGTVTITAKTIDGSGKSASIKLKIAPPNPNAEAV